MQVPRQYFNYVIYILLISFVITLYFISGPQNEFWWSDESRHAMDGVFFYDFFRYLPFDHLRAYLEEYIVRFPALSFTWNLPFFALVEAPFFALFGVNVFTAQMVVLGFACVLSIAMHKWSQEFVNPITAALAVMLFFLNDTTLLWMRSVMLEIPALTMMLLFILAFKQYIHSPAYKWAILTGCLCFSMLMTKQTTLFFLPVIIIYAWYNKKLSTLWDKHSWPAYVLILTGILVIAIHALTIGKSGFTSVSNTSSNIIQVLLFQRVPLMLKVISQVFSWPILLLSITGIVLGFINGEKRKIVFLLSWLVFGILFISFLSSLSGNIARYCIYIAPPLYLLALLSIDFYRKGSRPYYIFTGLSVCLLVWSAYSALQQTQPYLKGYKEIAKYVHELPDKRPVMFCCNHDGNYIFSIRSLDQEHNSITLRADKMLVSIVITPGRGVISHTSNQEQIVDLLDSYGVGYLVIEEGTYPEVKEFEMLRKVVRGKQFEKLRTFTTSSSDGSYKGWAYDDGIIVNIYRYQDAKEIKDGKISIPLPRFGREVTLEIK